MDFSELDRTIDRVGSERAVAELGPWLTEERRERIEHVLRGRLDALHVAVERPEDPYNAAAIVRSAEAIGALHVHVVTEHESALHARKTTQGSFNWVHTYHHPELPDLIATLERGQVRVCGALMEGSLRLEELPIDRPLCLLFGNEKTGLSASALQACDLTFRIPMYGMSESLNLSVSASLALYSVAQRKRALLGCEGDLTGARLMRERARYYARCVDERTLLAL
ncbi:MAG: putative tRNA/rRNA methyltransferase [Myxococcaceae bacterium]|nr:putative tRNA/rRNA methyltransferase [Myxococcaceae bacterium]